MTLVGRGRALVGLDAQPGHAGLLGDADGAHDLLGRPGEHVSAGGDLGVGRLGRQRRVAKGAGKGDVDLHVGIGGLHAGQESVYVQLGVTRVHRPDQADNAHFGQVRRQHAADVATLLGARLVGEDVGKSFVRASSWCVVPQAKLVSGKSGAISKSEVPYCAPWAMTRS